MKTKAEKQPRLANVIETSRRGDKIVGQIDKRTGKPVAEIEKPKPAKAKDA